MAITAVTSGAWAEADNATSMNVVLPAYNGQALHLAFIFLGTHSNMPNPLDLGPSTGAWKHVVQISSGFGRHAIYQMPTQTTPGATYQFRAAAPTRMVGKIVTVRGGTGVVNWTRHQRPAGSTVTPRLLALTPATADDWDIIALLNAYINDREVGTAASGSIAGAWTLDTAQQNNNLNARIQGRKVTSGLSQPAIDVSGYAFDWSTGALRVLVTGNRPPLAPTVQLGAGTVLRADVTTFIPFDPNDLDAGDVMSAWSYQVRASGSTTLLRNLYIPSTSSTLPLSGPLFGPGDFELRISTEDRVGTPGPFSAWIPFTLADQPDLPTIVAPGNGATINTATVAVEVSAPVVEASRFKVYADDGGSPDLATVLYDSGVLAADVRVHEIAYSAWNGSTVHTAAAIQASGLWTGEAVSSNLVAVIAPPLPRFTVVPVQHGLVIEGDTEAPTGEQPDVAEVELWARVSEAHAGLDPYRPWPNGAPIKAGLAGTFAHADYGVAGSTDEQPIDYEVTAKVTGDNGVKAMSDWVADQFVPVGRGNRLRGAGAWGLENATWDGAPLEDLETAVLTAVEAADIKARSPWVYMAWGERHLIMVNVQDLGGPILENIAIEVEAQTADGRPIEDGREILVVASADRIPGEQPAPHQTLALSWSWSPNRSDPQQLHGAVIPADRVIYGPTLRVDDTEDFHPRGVTSVRWLLDGVEVASQPDMSVPYDMFGGSETSAAPWALDLSAGEHQVEAQVGRTTSEGGDKTLRATVRVEDTETEPGAVTIVSATASTFDVGNGPELSLDGDPATYTAVEGVGQHITYQLSSTRLIGAIRVAWFRGNERVMRFDVQVPDGAGGWTTISSPSSSGLGGFEAYPLADVSTDRVRLVNRGNTRNAFMSIIDVEVLAAGATPTPAKPGVPTASVIAGNGVARHGGAAGPGPAVTAWSWFRGTTQGGPYPTVLADQVPSPDLVDDTVVNATGYFAVLRAHNAEGYTDSAEVPYTPSEAPTSVSDRRGTIRTEREKLQDRSRFSGGPYKSRGDRKSNSPAAGNAVIAAKDSFDGGETVWDGSGTVGQTSVYDRATTVRGTSRDAFSAALWAHAFDDTGKANQVKNFLLRQASNSGARSRLDQRPSNSALSDVGSHPYMDIAAFMSSQFLALPLIDDMDVCTATELASLRAYGEDAGAWLDHCISTKWTDKWWSEAEVRNPGVYPTPDADAGRNSNSDAFHYVGSERNSEMQFKLYNNRWGTPVRGLGVIAAYKKTYEPEPDWDNLVKWYVGGYMHFAMDAKGGMADMYRDFREHKYGQGLRYVGNMLGHLTTCADLFARQGDTWMYEFGTTLGHQGTAGVPVAPCTQPNKNLLTAWDFYAIYAGDLWTPTRESDGGNDLDGYYRGTQKNPDSPVSYLEKTMAAPALTYYSRRTDAPSVASCERIRKMVLHTGDGALDGYPADPPANGRNDIWEGEQAIFGMGYALMFLENEHWPYAAGA